MTKNSGCPALGTEGTELGKPRACRQRAVLSAPAREEHRTGDSEGGCRFSGQLEAWRTEETLFDLASVFRLPSGDLVVEKWVCLTFISEFILFYNFFFCKLCLHDKRLK